MYQAIHSPEHISENETVVRYPDKYILMLYSDLNGRIGTVEYVGDDDGEMYELQFKSEDPSVQCVIEGLGLQRRIGPVTKWFEPCVSPWSIH
jgi:hypothetical protein